MKKYICIASISGREAMLRKTLDSLSPQCDMIYLALNNYEAFPSFVQGRNIFTVLRDNSKGDAERYFCIDKLEGYLFTCDDDLIYPSDYVKYMIQGINKHKSVVTLHGKTYPRPVRTFREYMGNYRCLDDVTSDGRVDVGGTGVMAWHSSMVNICYENFKSKNMADLWFSKLCWEQGVKIMCLAHKKGNLGYQQPAETIWDEEKKKGFAEQTELLKSFLK